MKLQDKPTILKQSKQEIENISMIYPKVHLTFIRIPSRVASFVIGGNITDYFLSWFAKCRGKQESPPSFMFSNMERTKAQQNSLLRMFLGSGGRFIEREGVSTLSIHGYPWALRYLLLCFQNVCFKMWVGLKKSFFERFLNNSCICPQECLKNLFWKLLKV